ncbi:MAG: hypothetical protein EU542_04340 [Promethearchaeota archaeon]|nr:MAG: hypothetical protein EU542_04340 [Candidatus Lokiarchaeota archaeon]
MDRDISYLYKNFGEKIYYIGVLTVLTIFSGGLAQIAICILFLQALRNIKSINQKLNNSYLQKFRFRIFGAVIIDLAGFIIFLILTGITIFHIINVLPTLYLPSTDPLTILGNTYGVLIFVLMFALSLSFGRIILYFSSWNALNKFFRSNLVQFPPNIVNKTIEGTGRLKKGYLLTLVGGTIAFICMILLVIFIPMLISMVQESSLILSDFILGLIFYSIMAITAFILAIIGFILTILGYFDLSQLRNL